VTLTVMTMNNEANIFNFLIFVARRLNSSLLIASESLRLSLKLNVHNSQGRCHEFEGGGILH